jgi:hypothetical protein
MVYSPTYDHKPLSFNYSWHMLVVKNHQNSFLNIILNSSALAMSTKNLVQQNNNVAKQMQQLLLC